jgi:hypothetical protein
MLGGVETPTCLRPGIGVEIVFVHFFACLCIIKVLLLFFLQKKEPKNRKSSKAIFIPSTRDKTAAIFSLHALPRLRRDAIPAQNAAIAAEDSQNICQRII